MSALDELLRRIEDAIDATSDRMFAGQSTVTRTTRDTGPAIVRAVLEATLPDVDVCPDCEHPTPAQWHAEPDPDQEAPY
jgi:hypothetical protein